MGLFICKICDEHLGLDIDTIRNHQCDRQQAEAYVEKLERRAHEAEKKLDDIQQAVFLILKEMPAFEKDQGYVIDPKFVQELWEAAECQWHKSMTAEDFHVQWMATHRVLCEAYDLFRSKKYGHAQTILGKLQDVRKACDESKEILGYQDSHFDMTPEDLVNEAQKGN